MIHFVRSHLPQWRFSGKIPACSGTPDSAFPLLQSLASCGSDRASLMRKKESGAARKNICGIGGLVYDTPLVAWYF